MSRGKLKRASDHELAARIRKAIGAGPDEDVGITTPTFNRDIRSPPPADAPRTAAEFEALKTLRPDELRALGLRGWADTDEAWPGESRLWLFPAEWYDHIPDGTKIVDISGRRERFRRGESDNDRRFGVLAYGILADEMSR